MKETLQLMSQLTDAALMATPLETLAMEYRKDLNPQILATAFCKTYGLIQTVAGNFFGLTSEDVASYALEKLDLCLVKFNPGEYAFNTFFTKVLSNKFREETQALSTQKRKAMLQRVSYEALVEQGFEAEANNKKSISQVLGELDGCHLTQRETRYCELVMQSYSNSEIAKMFNMSVTGVLHVRNKIRQKLTVVML